MSKKPLTGAERKAQLLDAGAKLAAKHGAVNVTRRMVAVACGCAEALVSVYMGDSATAQKAYARKAKALGLSLPDKKTTEELGIKLRAHGPRDKHDTRKRSAKEVEAIKRKQLTKGPSLGAAMSKALGRETKPKRAPRPAKPIPASAPALPSPGVVQTPPERKSAARKPKAPPSAITIIPSS